MDYSRLGEGYLSLSDLLEEECTTPDGFKFIYALIDPRDHTRRYIGQTNNLSKRVGDHLKHKGNLAFGMWLSGLEDNNLIFLVKILALAVEGWAEFIEGAIIEKSFRSGYPLTNMNNFPGNKRPLHDWIYLQRKPIQEWPRDILEYLKD